MTSKEKAEISRLNAIDPEAAADLAEDLQPEGAAYHRLRCLTGKPAIWDLVITDMNARDAMGERKYGTRLKPHNGRDVLKDAYEEALDLAVYLRQALYERDAK